MSASGLSSEPGAALAWAPGHSRGQPHKHWGRQTTPRTGAYVQAYGVTHWSGAGSGTHTTFLGSADRHWPEVSVPLPLTTTMLTLWSLNPTHTPSPSVIPCPPPPSMHLPGPSRTQLPPQSPWYPLSWRWCRVVSFSDLPFCPRHWWSPLSWGRGLAKTAIFCSGFHCSHQVHVRQHFGCADTRLLKTRQHSNRTELHSLLVGCRSQKLLEKS